MSRRDLYEVLGVSRTATPEEIKRAYRKLAKQHHPDQNRNDPSAEKRFKDIQHAYSILKDKDKRNRYDQFGEVGVGDFRTGSTGERVYSWGGGGQQINAEDLEDLFRGIGGGGGSIFEQFFGGKRRARADRPGPVRGKDVHRTINLAFEDAIRGTSVEIDVGDQVGRGGRRETLKVKIPAGIGEGQQIRLRGKGASGINGGPAGDLLLTCNVRPHRVFRRTGRDLYVDLPVTFPEAALGAKVDVPTLDGAVTMTIAAGTAGGSKLRLKGRGIPGKGTTPNGDLYVVIRIVVPQALNAEHAEMVRSLQEIYAKDVRADLTGG